MKINKVPSLCVCVLLIFVTSITACDLSGVGSNLGNRMDELQSTSQNQLSSGGDDNLVGSPLEPTIYGDSDVPQDLVTSLSSIEGLSWVEDRDAATFLFHRSGKDRPGDQSHQQTSLIYALVAPFPTLTDDLFFQNLLSFWQGRTMIDFTSLRMTAETLEVLTGAWGRPGSNKIEIIPSGSIDVNWTDLSAWAILRFDELDPNWKVISLDGVSPLDPDESLDGYPLAFTFRLSGKTGSESLRQSIAPAVAWPESNRDTEKMTRLVMTGVTALVRATADKMESKGIAYPAGDIRDWLRSADITHISNEVAFIDGCPAPDPYTTSLRFCSDPKYIGLLEDVGTDVVEMTGNHMNDWYDEGPAMSLALYSARGWQDFGGGIDLSDSRQPALFDIHGNKIAFIGCNDPGPDFALSTETRGGSAGCEDYAWMIATIQELKLDGYQVVATVQYHENYSYLADNPVRALFRALVDAGAVVVQGSQAHTPKEMEFYGDGFIHYGLGNLFFDQMHYTLNGQNVGATRQEFIDRYTFCDNRLISIELLTAMLEDYARPRPMTQDERRELLEAVFSVSIWD